MAETGNSQRDTTRVAVLASDEVTEVFWMAGLSAVQQIEAVRTDICGAAFDVAVVVTEQFRGDVVERLSALAERAGGRIRPLLVVCPQMNQYQALAALDLGLVRVFHDLGPSLRPVVAALLGSRRERVDLPTGLQHLLVSRIRSMRRPDAPVRQITPREQEVVRLLAEGLSTAEIAAQLNYSERTIKAELSSVISRFSVRNRSHLVAFAFQNDIL